MPSLNNWQKLGITYYFVIIYLELKYMKIARIIGEI